MKRTTNDTRKRTTKRISVAVGLAMGLALMPGAAFAASDSLAPAQASFATADAGEDAGESVNNSISRLLARIQDEIDAQTKASNAANKTLSYNPEDIEQIGTQEESGHTICCPSFSCAYADAVLDGTVNDHEYYTCSNCEWTDWGGGESSDRCVGSDEELLREAYDQISAGKPTVIHVATGYGEHWIALIGYTDVTDPDHLTLENFIALDPWDGAQINAADRFELYGDGCEHISER